VLPIRPAVIAEFIGTFILVFAGCGAIAVGTLPASGVAAVFGLAIMISIYTFGHISGAHFNPAVTLAFAVGRHFPWNRVLPYWGAQAAGAIAGAGMLRLTIGSVSSAVARPAGSDLQAFTWEALLTFILMIVIVAVATDTRAVGQGAAIAIGGAVALGSLVGGPISGAAMNPARALGPALVASDLSNLWLYLVAPPVGAVCAVVVYRYLAPRVGA
jgi:aquaporin NIP